MTEKVMDQWSLVLPSTQPPLADRMTRDLGGIYTLWLRDVIRLWRDRIRLVGSFIQPLLFLFILGGGLAPRLGLWEGREGVNLWDTRTSCFRELSA